MRRSWSIGVAAATVLISFFTSGGPAIADPHNDQDKINQQLAQTRSDLEVDSERVQQAAAAYQTATQQLTVAQQNMADARGVLAGAQAHEISTAREAKAAQDSAERAEQAVTALIGRQGAALQTAQSEKAATLARYDDLQAESDRIAAQIRAQAATGGGQLLRPGARLPMPVVGWKSSDFGMRFDPYYHVWQLHAGVDLAAAAGTAIWAVAAGRVIQAGWDGGYGNYTCIYHGLYQGQAFATCYAHQSQILVHVGEQVRQGQVIGRVGTTGAATGDHLHFEVRLNGVPVDPVPWLPACLC